MICRSSVGKLYSYGKLHLLYMSVK